MNPGPPAPQAGILNQARRRPHQDTQRIINTLLEMKAKGLSSTTIYDISHKLKRLNQLADFRHPEEVKMAIANMKVCNNTKTGYAKAYQYFVNTNGLEWKRPKYKWERKIPLIPTTANIDKIISASSKKYATIFTILKETGLEGHELATTKRTHIDSEQGIINAQGCKGHNSRSLKLKPTTAGMLRRYLHRYTGETPFPSAKSMGEMWRRVRNRLAKTLEQPQLKAIPLRNLRHYQATRLYDKTKDILLVMQKLGHKKIRNNHALYSTRKLQRR